MTFNIRGKDYRDPLPQSPLSNRMFVLDNFTASPFQLWSEFLKAGLYGGMYRGVCRGY